jgi:hypothetical protein
MLYYSRFSGKMQDHPHTLFVGEEVYTYYPAKGVVHVDSPGGKKYLINMRAHHSFAVVVVSPNYTKIVRKTIDGRSRDFWCDADMADAICTFLTAHLSAPADYDYLGVLPVFLYFQAEIPVINYMNLQVGSYQRREFQNSGDAAHMWATYVA